MYTHTHRLLVVLRLFKILVLLLYCYSAEYGLNIGTDIESIRVVINYFENHKSLLYCTGSCNITVFAVLYFFCVCVCKCI